LTSATLLGYTINIFSKEFSEDNNYKEEDVQQKHEENKKKEVRMYSDRKTLRIGGYRV